jgi:hypothetical protein
MATESLRHTLLGWGLEDLLLHSGLRLVPTSSGIRVSGALAFVAEAPGKERISDEYQIELTVSSGFPVRLPCVRESGGRIPPSFHKLHDGSLCLGSPTRLRLILTESRSIARFVERCVVPYLYSYSYFEKHDSMPFGELKHGEEGIRQDLAALYGTNPENAIRDFVRLTAMRKRLANKHRCPCGSRRRLGRCHHRRVNALRSRLGRPWFRMLRNTLREDLVGPA